MAGCFLLDEKGMKKGSGMKKGMKKGSGAFSCLGRLFFAVGLEFPWAAAGAEGAGQAESLGDPLDPFLRGERAAAPHAPTQGRQLLGRLRSVDQLRPVRRPPLGTLRQEGEEKGTD